jgi:isopentenyl phosphate kinase
MTTLSESASRRSLVFVKLGGSLITDKMRPETVRTNVLQRLAEELAQAIKSRGGDVVLGHGSGSFGHAAAKKHGFDREGETRTRPAALAAVQDAAARLHRKVIAALIEAGADPISIVPGSAFVATRGQIRPTECNLIESAVSAGCLPVLYGDLVFDRERTASILSTESIFLALIRCLLESGVRIDHVLWLGETAGILDSDGRVVRRVDPASSTDLVETVGGAWPCARSVEEGLVE